MKPAKFILSDRPVAADHVARKARVERAARPERGTGPGRAATTIAAAAALGLLAGGAYLYLMPAQLTAVSRVVVERVEGPTSAPATAERRTDSFLAAQANVVRSSEVLRLADANADFHSMPTFAAARDPLPLIRHALRVDVAGNGGVLTVAFPSRDVEEARRVVDAIVRAYVTYQSDRRRERVAALTKEADEARKPLAEEAARAARALAETEAALAARGAPDALAQRVRSSVDAVVQSQGVVAEARRAYDDAVADAGALLSKLSDDDLDRVIRNASFAGVDTPERVIERLDAATRQMGELRRTYAENHPAVVRLRVQIDRLRIERVASARRSWQAAVTRQSDAKAAADRASADSSAMTSVVDERARRRADVDHVQQRLADSDRRLDVARGLTSGIALNVEVLTRAEADDPAYPPSPRPIPTLALALLAGLGIGATLATHGEYRRAGTLRHVAPRRPRDGSSEPSEARLARDAFGLRVLGNVPEIPAGGDDQAAGLRGDPSAPLGVAADAIRAAIVAEGFDRGTLAITSQRNGEGCSTIALAVASAMARAGGRVLLIDASGGGEDQSEGTGFADALIDGTLDGRTVPSPVANLTLLGAGRALLDFDLFLNSPRLPEVLAAAAERFDQVVVDCPSLSAADTAQIVAASTDAAMLVSDGAVAALRRAASGRDVLQLVGARVLGVAINRVRHAGVAAAEA